jgi:8-oxo-dGTP pyrophosphatase MutT (NUDIX family)
MGASDRAAGRRVRRAAGCVVYRRVGQQLQFLLIRDPYERWSLPKGHLEGDEIEEQAAAREVLEETGVVGKLGPRITTIIYTFLSHGRRVEKHVTFFLMAAVTEALTPQLDEGIQEADWHAADDALRLIGYEQVRSVLARAITMLEGQR